MISLTTSLPFVGASNGSLIPDLINPTDEYLMDPYTWMHDFSSLDSFTSRKWVDGMILDIWLTKFWADLQRDDFRYVPIANLRFQADSGSPNSLATTRVFRRRFRLPQTGPCPLQTVAGCLVKNGNHYFTIIVNPLNKTMHILGRDHLSNSFLARPLTQASDDIQEAWSTIAALHGWNFDLDFNVYELNWKQNGYDCGPIVCQVLEHIWIHGFRVSGSGRWLKPHLPCCHFIRRRIVSDFHQLVWSSIREWQQMDANALEMTAEEFSVRIEMVTEFCKENSPNSLSRIQEKMDQEALSCTSCPHPNALALPPLAPTGGLPLQKLIKPSVKWLPLPPRSSSSDDDESRESSPPQPKKKTVQFPPPAATLPLSHLQNSDPLQLNPSDDESSESSMTQLKKKKKTVQKPCGLDRFPRPTSPPPLVHLRNSDSLFLSSEMPYDDYENGPTSEVLDPIPNTILTLGEIDLIYLAEKIISNPWTTFLDYGYRLEQDFGHAFKRLEPVDAHRNLMPVGVKGPPSPPDEPPFPFPELLDLSRRGGLYESHDSCTLGIEEMIQLANEQRNNLIFLTGKVSSDSYVTIDLEKDAMPHESVQVEKAIDVDSIIWVTRHPRFSHSISIFTKPVIRHRAPIFKHNHLFVKLIVPQSEDDRLAQGARTEWQPRKIKLCNVPHVFFGKSGDGSASCNLYLAFPRMYHKHPYINRYESLIPPHVQSILWEQVIIPAMDRATPDVSHPYVGLDLSHQAMKSTSQQTASYPFRPAQLSELLLCMENLVGLSRLVLATV